MQPQRELYHGKSVRAMSEEKMWQILSHKCRDVNRKCHHYQASPGTWIISVKDWLGNEWQERKRESHAHTPFPQQVSKPNHRACMDPTWRRRAGGRRRWLLRKRSNLRIRWLDNVSCRLSFYAAACTTLRCEMPALTATSVIC